MSVPSANQAEEYFDQRIEHYAQNLRDLAVDRSAGVPAGKVLMVIAAIQLLEQSFFESEVAAFPEDAQERYAMHQRLVMQMVQMLKEFGGLCVVKQLVAQNKSAALKHE